jgi:SAM-dependent methyltransferase
MVVSAIEFGVLKAARDADVFASVKSILEFGVSNTRNLDMRGAIEALLPPGEARTAALAEAASFVHAALPGYYWARLLYRVIFNDASYVAIDLEPKSPLVIQQDLNEPFDLGKRFDLCINNGTSEHIFNQANFYKAMHDHTKTGGLMLHWTPCVGWIDHGFYNVQPGFFGDVAHANNYEMIINCLGTEKQLYQMKTDLNEAVLQQYPDLRNSLACVLMRKTEDLPFRQPMQGTHKHLQQYQNQ